MKKILKDYFYCFMHPVEATKSHDIAYYRGPYLLHSTNTVETPRALNLGQYIALSWPWVMMEFLYSLLALWLSKYLVLNFGEEGATRIFSQLPLISVWTGLLFIVLFPIYAVLYVKLWSFFISLCLQLFGVKLSEDEIEHIASNSLVANMLLAIPLMGPILKKLGSIFYMFVGLKSKASLTSAQAVVILLAPVMLSVLFFMVWLLMIYLALS